MRQGISKIIHQNSVFLWLGLASIALLTIPFVAMQVTPEVNWELADFILMGCLLFGTASLFVLAARKWPAGSWPVLAGVAVAAFLLVWAELAVGIFNL